MVAAAQHNVDAALLQVKIAEVNREAGGDRQVDFLTLREDYSVPPECGLSHDERARMVDIFAELKEPK